MTLDSDPRLAEAARVCDRIRTVLVERWQPLGADGSSDAAAAAYERSIGPLYQLLATGAGPLRIAAELAEAERRLGRQTPVRALVPLARVLRALDVRLTVDGVS